MKILIRVDSSNQIGSGHVFRCLSLADALIDFDCHCQFVCRESIGSLVPLIKQRGYPVLVIANPEVAAEEYAQLSQSRNGPWLMTPDQQEFDVNQTINAVGDQRFDWVIVDHYQLDQIWQRKVRSIGKRVMVIDDLADRHHDCDLLLDQNLVARYQTRYSDKVSVTCGKLLGPEFVILNQDYRTAKNQVRPRKPPVSRVLIYFGGADKTNLTGMAIQAFQHLNRPDIWLDVVVHCNSPWYQQNKKMIDDHKNIGFHHSLPSLASLMLQADIAIGAAGATSWERCCLGLPSIVIAMADNQLPIAEELHRRRLIQWIGHRDTVTINDLAVAMTQVIDDPKLTEWSTRCAQLIDACGAEKVASFISINPQTPLRARPLTATDEQQLLDWANDPEVRQHSIQSQTIDPHTHRQWFAKQMQQQTTHRCYIIENLCSIPIGLVRFSRTTSEILGDLTTERTECWEVHYQCDSRARRRGIGTKLLRTGLERFITDFGQATIIGRVKPGNIASQKVLEKLGFRPLQSPENGTISYCRQVNPNTLDSGATN